MAAEPADLSTQRLQAELADLRAVVADRVGTMAELDRACAVAIDALIAELPPTEVYRTSQFGVVRDAVFSRLDEFSRQLTAVRAEAIRLHVDLEGRSLTEVAALIGRSRQFVTRLYRQASGG